MLAENRPENADRPSVEPVTSKAELKLRLIARLSERVIAMGYPLATPEQVVVDPVYRALAASMLQAAALKKHDRTLVDDIAKTLFYRLQKPMRLTSSQKKRMSRVIGRRA